MLLRPGTAVNYFDGTNTRLRSTRDFCRDRSAGSPGRCGREEERPEGGDREQGGGQRRDAGRLTQVHGEVPEAVQVEGNPSLDLVGTDSPRVRAAVGVALRADLARSGDADDAVGDDVGGEVGVPEGADLAAA